MHAEVKDSERIQIFRHFRKHGGVMIITYDMYHRSDRVEQGRVGPCTEYPEISQS